MLGFILQPEARRLVSAGQTGNPEAYQLYQEALGYLRRFEQHNVARAIRLLHDAIAKDPQYALAFAPAGRGLLAHSCSVRTLLTPSSRSAT